MNLDSNGGVSMLTDLHPVLPAADLGRARTYYHDKLGFDPVEEHDGMLIYRAGGTAQNTQMGWMTDDIEAEVAQLRDHGVVFEEYDFPGMKTVDGIVSSDEMKSAWFRDSEGNFICVTQRL
jgi:catechol 2,3-dioxygenase-like lactoylglutathione lyase family enzyme